MTANIPQLTIEVEQDGTVLLEQQGCGDSARIRLHPLHIRYLTELAGLVQPLHGQPMVAVRFLRAGVQAAHEQDAAEQLAQSYFAAP
jgi:hypothetical protein